MEPISADRGRVLPDHLRAPCLHGGFWRRAAAYLIDGLVLGIPMMILWVVLLLPTIMAASHRGNPDVRYIFLIYWPIAIVIPWLYFALLESSKWQATPGKMALALQVTDLHGRRIGFGRATGRYFGKFVSRLILDIGYMMAGWTARKQALHDMMAGTCVLNRAALRAWEKGDLPESTAVPSSMMPSWAVALIVIGACFFMSLMMLGILAAIAIPAYQEYTIRVQIAEGMTLANGAKTAVAEYIGGHNGSLPPDNAAAGLAEPVSISSNYVAEVQIENGNVEVTYGNRANAGINGGHIALAPQTDRGMVFWQCSSPDIKSQYLPEKCR
ncbi:MAG: RDD family protein [Rhodanobacteraceae bacterium]